ncbi:unnamed protein product [Rotaria socialis]|uniref:Tudor domain-containing protein n=1 Tax=Rotaria socialis TaxID=392032 RepID=A0A817Q7D7_9BILA|nr:unnamed protein product [Rotaria socialis]CAF3303171.1 unnamed protein product [Rotaria socialis]CAF3316238.1 unnamed protein product [Rotaria socialis]CAF3487480.1 unnamed protein product [Rotaria socialis]CAF4134478.1 unnamed protein product [Rotaria socialis]
MQHPSIGFRGAIRIGHHYTHNHRIENTDNNDLSVSNSNSDEKDDNLDVKHTSIYSPIGINSDFELAIRNLRPAATSQKKIKTNLNISKQKADLPQLNTSNDDHHSNNKTKQKHSEDNVEDKPSCQWFPKPDVGHVNSDDFIRHNHVESQQQQLPEILEQTTPPALLTTIPPVGISTRPTAIVASADPTRSISAFFSSNSSIKKATSYNNIHNNTVTKINEQQQQQQISSSSSSAFQPINSSSQNNLQNQSAMKPAPVLMDIPQHKALERGQQLNRVHIAHPQSPSTVHLMLHTDFNTACRLLREMAVHSELQNDQLPTQPFKAQVNRLCACYHEGRWFRCRILQISPDFSTATVVYLDWGMTIAMQIGPEYIRRLPNEFYAEPACCIMCYLDGVPDKHDLMSPEVLAQCIALLSENEYDVTVNGYDSATGGKILLSLNGRIINDQIRQLLVPNTVMTPEEESIEQFRHELPLSVGDELKALLSSFSGKDNSFYVLLVNENTVVIDQAMSQLQGTNISNCSPCEMPRIKTLVVARYADDGKWYRAWVKSICLQRQQATVFFVDFGNESTVMFSDIYACPESVRTLPWLGIRVRLTNDIMTHDELASFWKIAESNYIWIKILEILKDSYGIQIKIDYTILLRQERIKLLSSNLGVHMGVQTMLDERSLSAMCPSRSVEINSCLATPSIADQSQIGNENLIRNLFEMISNELRRLRHRINDSDEASQDRHSQLMQLLFSTFNLNNSNNQKRL